MSHVIPMTKRDRTSTHGRRWETEKGWNEVVLEHGAQRIHCPVCGHALLVPDDGLAKDPCPHVVFVYDSIGEFAYVRADHRSAIRRTEEILDRFDGGERLFRDTLLADLPQTAIVLEFVRPAQGSDDGDTIVVAFDLERAQLPRA